jgi:hypothetical protein
MTVKSISFDAPFAWLAASVESLRKDSGALFGATALLLMVVLVPAVIQQVLLKVMQPMTMGTVLVIQAFFLVISTLVVPPVMGGYYRILHARAQGLAMQPATVFALFREPAAAKRMIGTELIFLAVSVAMLLAMYFAVGGYVGELMKVIAAATPGKTPEFPAPPSGFLLWVMLFAFVGMIVMTARTLAFAQAALGSRSPIEAVGDGFAAALRNLGAFIVFYLAICFAGFLFLLVFALVIGIITVVLGYISPILVLAVIVPIYLVLVLAICVVLFGFNYQAWRGTLGDDNAPVEQQIAA